MTHKNLKKLSDQGNLTDISFLESVVHIYKIISHKTYHEVDLETEPVCSPIMFNSNLLISDESESELLRLQFLNKLKVIIPGFVIYEFF
jgi:hypothetical protein